jgi:hypothetical protein
MHNQGTTCPALQGALRQLERELLAYRRAGMDDVRMVSTDPPPYTAGADTHAANSAPAGTGKSPSACHCTSHHAWQLCTVCWCQHLWTAAPPALLFPTQCLITYDQGCILRAHALLCCLLSLSVTRLTWGVTPPMGASTRRSSSPAGTDTTTSAGCMYGLPLTAVVYELAKAPQGTRAFHTCAAASCVPSLASVPSCTP